jgi:hypothetical protein
MAKTAPPEPAPVLECAVAHSFDNVDGAAVTVVRGTRLRADHPTVLAAPSLWVDPLAPDDERPFFDHGTGGVTTTHKPIPSGWRRDLHGGGKPWDQQP